MQGSRRSHLLRQEWWTMLGRTHWVERLGLWWCSGAESGVIQSHHCPVPPCSASYSSLQSQLHACRASQSSFPGNRKCSPSPSVSLRLPIAFLAGWWYQHSVSWAHCLWQPFSWRHWCPENLPWGPTSKSGPSNIPVQELVSCKNSFVVALCNSLRSTVRMSPSLHAPNEESRLWWDNTLLTGGSPAKGGWELSSEIRKSLRPSEATPVILMNTNWAMTYNW